jgi:serine beta-lactamase-like protein LACTB, mitochondrial
MFTTQTTRDGRPTGYGMGWSTGRKDGRRFVAHSGSQQGTSTYLILYPPRGVSITVMENRENARAAALAEQIATVLFEP